MNAQINNSLAMSKRVGIIDIGRFLYIFLIVLHHTYFFKNNILWGGYIGVEFFYIVTGWLFARSCYTKKNLDVFSFLFHKIKGFYPEFLVATTTGFILMSFFDKDVHGHWLMNFVYWISDIFLLQIWGFPTLSATAVSWFLSAMIGSLCILAPLALYKPRLLSFYAFPIIISIYGFLCVNYGSLSPILQPVAGGLIHAGLLRAMADILVGYLSFSMSMKLANTEFSNGRRKVMGILEMGGYLVSLYLVFRMNGPTRIDFLIVLLLAMSVTISFSEVTFTKRIHGSICDRLGKYSLNIYLSHGCLAIIFGKMAFPEHYGMAMTMAMYFILVIVLSVINNRASYLIRKKL